MKSVILLIEKNKKSAQVYWIKSNIELSAEFLNELSFDPDTLLISNSLEKKYNWQDINSDELTLIHFLPGVTDNPAQVFKEMLQIYHPNFSFEVKSGQLVWNDENYNFNELIQVKIQASRNNLILEGLPWPREIQNLREIKVEEFNLSKLSLEELVIISKNNKWALNTDELFAIQKHYQSEPIANQRRLLNLPESATDVEMEIIAQSWSEHCKHKIFSAEIKYTDENESFTVDNLYKTYIKGSTFKINKPWAVSVFKDNAGIVDWDESNYLAIKVETHNSPSALDPYGGALTGILGVNRDILGTGLGFMPIANTDVFCVGEWDESSNIPKKIMHPKNILKGIHRGIQDGGNKSGIPTVNGAMCFNENFTGKPLVYCGTIGIAPKNSVGIDNKDKYQEVNDLIIMAGGRVGLDGIHGATMSSIALDESVPKTMVQIGDPFTQRKLSEFILFCRDNGLMTGITDNGAGGLSSSIGEMAEKTNGAKLYLDRVPLKYPGLSPWEIIVSESQERMSLAIRPHDLEIIKKIAQNFGIEISVVGEFTDNGLFQLYYHDNCVGAISLDFLHHGLPQMKLVAHWEGPKSIMPSWKAERIKKESRDINEILKVLLNDRNIASKDQFIRQYDHEVKASTIVKPLDGIKRNSPNDSGVLKLSTFNGDMNTALAIASGIQYQFSHIDTELMTKLSFDEAMRSVVVVGANPSKVAMTDNFCWPDPLLSDLNPDASHKLAQLVRSCRALYEIAVEYKVPLISGKDSMKNDYIDEKCKISVPPTLLMTAIGHINNIKNIKRTAITKENSLVYLIGVNFGDLYFGHFLNKYFDFNSNNNFQWKLKESIDFYNKYFENIELIKSGHDVSDGGVLVALCESLFGAKLGIHFEKSWTIEKLFSEYPSQFIVSIDKLDRVKFEAAFDGYYQLIGETNNKFIISGLGTKSIDLEQMEFAWRNVW